MPTSTTQSTSMRRGERGFSLPRGERGFSLIELAVALAVMIIVMFGLLALFDMNERIGKVQTRVTEMQQSLRIAQYDVVRLVRMAGRGNLATAQTGSTLPTGVAVSVRDNVAVGSYLIPGDNSSPPLVPGTDVITVRGAFTHPIYQVNSLDPNAYTLVDPTSPTDPRPATATGLDIVLCDPSPSGLPQDLTKLRAMIDEALATPARAKTEAMTIVSPVDSAFYDVVQLNPAGSSKTAASCPGGVNAGVTLKLVSDPLATAQAHYRELGPGGTGRTENIAATVSSVKYVTVIEEYRFYVRADRTADGELLPVLARARFFPNTDVPYQNDLANLRIDVAENILDLQASYGIDANGDGQVLEDSVDPTTDEWLLNAAGDLPIAGRLSYLRVTTLARTGGRDTKYQAPLIDAIENNDYTVGGAPPPHLPLNDEDQRMYRRRMLQTVVDLRNLS
jgi:type II secretory pathway pseudopilin PulG